MIFVYRLKTCSASISFPYLVFPQAKWTYATASDPCWLPAGCLMASVKWVMAVSQLHNHEHSPCWNPWGAWKEEALRRAMWGSCSPRAEEQRWECVESNTCGLGHLDFPRDHREVKVGYPQLVFHLVELFASKTAEWVLGVYVLLLF